VEHGLKMMVLLGQVGLMVEQAALVVLYLLEQMVLMGELVVVLLQVTLVDMVEEAEVLGVLYLYPQEYLVIVVKFLHVGEVVRREVLMMRKARRGNGRR
tara:strand:+ start:167 stop:463 length:297 start_codon:yes stop_codon:yes gene_type:complete